MTSPTCSPASSPPPVTTACTRSVVVVAVARRYPFTPSAPASTQGGRGVGKPRVN